MGGIYAGFACTSSVFMRTKSARPGGAITRDELLLRSPRYNTREDNYYTQQRYVLWMRRLMRVGDMARIVRYTYASKI